MKVYTSYFYQVRFFEPCLIPFSTAIWQPKWWPKEPSFDKRNILNGLIATELQPSCKGLEDKCRGRDGIGIICKGNPKECDFLRIYKEYLFSKDFNSILSEVDNKINQYLPKFQVLGYKREDLIPVFIVYEDSKNQCSERWVIQELFKHNGYECNELVVSKTSKG